MTPGLNYHLLIKNSKEPKKIRKVMVDYYYETRNISKTARMFKTNRVRVKKWVRRYQEKGHEGLGDNPKIPHSSPNKVSQEEENLILELRGSKNKVGQDRIQIKLWKKHKIFRSTSTINRILNNNQRIEKRKKKWQKKREITEYRKRAKALRCWQIDVKELCDIPNIFSQVVVLKILPRYQYSAVDVKTGTAFTCYAFEESLLNSTRFVKMLLEHSKSFNIYPGDVIIQTDNGGEFIGNIFAKEDSQFTKLIEEFYNGLHQTIPAGRKEYNGFVESFHNRIEQEFYDIEDLSSLNRLLGKAYTFILDWNLDREKIETKKTPFEMIKQNTNILNAQICNLQPIVLDGMNLYISELTKTGTYVSDDINFSIKNPLFKELQAERALMNVLLGTY